MKNAIESISVEIIVGLSGFNDTIVEVKGNYASGWRVVGMIITIEQILDGHSDAFVESPGVGGRLKCQAELLIARSPVVERRHHFVVLEIFADRAA